MALQYSTTLRNDIADQFNTAIGTGGKIKLYTAGAGLIATYVWTGSMFTAASVGVITLNAPDAASVTAVATGTPTNATFTTSADAVIVSGLTVGLSASDIIIDNTSVNTGQSILLAYATSTITAPAA